MGKDICDSEYQGSADTSASKEHLRKQITESPPSSHRSTYFNHDTPKSKKKTMQSSELESGLPDEAEQECIVFFLLGAVVN